jgi:hypothetical protein
MSSDNSFWWNLGERQIDVDALSSTNPFNQPENSEPERKNKTACGVRHAF